VSPPVRATLIGEPPQARFSMKRLGTFTVPGEQISAGAGSGYPGKPSAQQLPGRLEAFEESAGRRRFSDIVN